MGYPFGSQGYPKDISTMLWDILKLLKDIPMFLWDILAEVTDIPQILKDIPRVSRRLCGISPRCLGISFAISPENTGISGPQKKNRGYHRISPKGYPRISADIRGYPVDQKIEGTKVPGKLLYYVYYIIVRVINR